MLQVAFLAGLGREEEAGIEIEGRLLEWQSQSQAAKQPRQRKSWKSWESWKSLGLLGNKERCFHKRINGSKGAPSTANTFFGRLASVPLEPSFILFYLVFISQEKTPSG